MNRRAAFPHRARIKRQYRQGDSRGKSPDRERGWSWGKKRCAGDPEATSGHFAQGTWPNKKTRSTDFAKTLPVIRLNGSGTHRELRFHHGDDVTKLCRIAR